MPRQLRPIQGMYPYHITLRAIERADFRLNISDFWDISSDLLWFCSFAYQLEIHAYVLMNNHYHMLVRTPEANLSEFMKYFNRELSREIGRKTSQINQKFGSRYHASIVRDLAYYHNVYKYVYRNPVEAGLCKLVEEYPFSSLNFILGKERFRFPVFDTYFDSLDSYLPNLFWLNTSYDEIERNRIKLGLKRTYFSI